MVLQDAHLLTSLDIEDLGRLVAAGGDILAVVAEANAANDALVGERVNQVDIQDALHLRVEDGIPVVARLLVVRRNGVDFKVAQRVADGRGRGAGTHASVVRRRVAHLRRLSIAGIRHGGVDLGGRGPDGVWRAVDGSATWAGRRGALRRLRAHAVGHDGAGALGIGLLLVWGLLLRRRLLLLLLLRVGVGRRHWQSWGSLSHLVVVRAHLLILGSGLRLRRRQTSLVATGHDAAEEAVSRSNRWGLLRRPCVLRRSLQTRLRSSLASKFELVPQHVDFLLISGELRCD